MAKEKATEMPGAGDVAPDFEGPTQTGDTLRLSDYRGRKVALYFYPNDDTPGCTKQACSLRDQYEDLNMDDIAVIGVSGNNIESHQKFAEKYQLPFPLVADPNREILARYGVWGEKSLYGKISIGTKRTTFLIDEEGVIRHVIKRPNVKEHGEEIRRKFGVNG